MTLYRHRFAVLRALEQAEITEDEAQHLMGRSVRSVRHMVTLWEGRLGRVTPIVDRLMEQTNTKPEQTALKRRLAKAMKTSYRQVNRLLRLSEIDVPPPISKEIRLEKRETARNRRKLRKKHAIDVILGLNDIESAATAAEVSARHIYRLIDQMLEELGTTWKDVKHMTDGQRRKIVSQLEKGLESDV